MSTSFLDAGLTAAGATATTALLLNANATAHQVSTCAAGAGVRLPLLQPNGKVMRVRNDGAGYLFVYPPTGGTINGMAVDIPLVVAAGGGEVDFVFSGGLSVLSLAVAGNQVQLVIPIAATGAVTAGMSGAIIPLSHAAATVVTLPAPAIGLNYRFIISADVANAVTISATAAIQSASLTSATTAAAECIATDCALRTSVVFTAGANVGSYYEVVSDGTLWYGKGVSLVAAGFTTA